MFIVKYFSRPISWIPRCLLYIHCCLLAAVSFSAFVSTLLLIHFGSISSVSPDICLQLFLCRFSRYTWHKSQLTRNLQRSWEWWLNISYRNQLNNRSLFCLCSIECFNLHIWSLGPGAAKHSSDHDGPHFSGQGWTAPPERTVRVQPLRLVST